MTVQTRKRRRVQRGASNPNDRQIDATSTVIQIQRGDVEGSMSRQLDDDDLFGEATIRNASVQILNPPYSPFRLYQIAEESNTIPPVIDAYVTNTVKSGWSLEPILADRPMKEAERVEALSFIESPNTEETLETVLTQVIEDREYTGNGYLECIRDVSGELSLLRAARATHTRVCRQIPEEVLVQHVIRRGRRESTIMEFRKFRRYVQVIGAKAVFFREFGDPRKMDRITGAIEGEPGYVAGRDATEIIHFRLRGNGPYGIPRWINQVPSVLGSRKSEMVNLNYFEDNTIPPMMMLVSGGRLTAHSYRNLTNLLSGDGLGKDRQNKIVLVEATGQGDSLDEKANPVDMKIEKLNDTRQSDALFQDYDKENRAKVRSAWRVPGIILGEVTQSNYANAQVATFVVESQVFGPARDEIDELLNKLIINGAQGLKIKTVRIKGRIPAINSPETVIKTLTALNVMGAVTPRSAQDVANQVLQNEIPPYPKAGEEGYEEWMDRPISITLRSASTTHEEQGTKTEEVKEIEDDGDPGFRRPENGSEGEVLEDE